MNLQKTARHLLGALLLVLLAWQALLSLGGYSEALFPSPLATLQGLYELLTDGVLVKDIGASLYRFAVGYLSSVLLAMIVFPAVFPRIATGLHLALGTAWVFLVAGEMVGAQSGLGFLIIDARNNLRADLLMAAIITIGVLGLLLDSGVTLVERAVSRRFGSRVA